MDASAEIAGEVVPKPEDKVKTVEEVDAGTATVDRLDDANVATSAAADERAEEGDRDQAGQSRGVGCCRLECKSRWIQATYLSFHLQMRADDESSLSMSWDDDISASSLMDVFDDKKEKSKEKAKSSRAQGEDGETFKDKDMANVKDKGALRSMRLGSDLSPRSSSSQISSYSPSTRSSNARTVCRFG